MKVLERPVEAPSAALLAAANGIVYYTPGLDVASFAPIFADLGLQPEALDQPAFVDVKKPRIFLVDGAELGQDRSSSQLVRLHSDQSVMVVAGRPGDGRARVDGPLENGIFAWLDDPIRPIELRYALSNALRQIELHERSRRAQRDLDHRAEQLADLHHVGVALSAEHDIDALQTLILSKARALTTADAGSLYLVIEEEQIARTDDGQPLFDANDNPVMERVKMLSFNLSQNVSNPTDFKAFKMPINAGIAGYVASTGNVVQHDDIYVLPDELSYAFNTDFDQLSGYRSKSMLCVPMVNSDGEIIGVIQLINRKYRPDVKLIAENVDHEVLPFSLEDRDLTLSFASQAAVALDNKRLIDSIQTLFEGFVTASVQAIESRDPTTSGHSGRVAQLTVGLADAISSIETGSWARTHFGPEHVREMRYAAVLHDFGKVGVRENVLVKAKKLYEWQVDQIRSRFGVARAALDGRFMRRKVEYLLAHGTHGVDGALAAIDGQFEEELRALEEYFQLVRQVNEPSVLEDDSYQKLTGMSALTYDSPGEGEEPLVQPGELKKLAIKKGSLDDNERLEIESHVTHTYKFLTKIPWTKDLRRVPEIAWAHHEKLNGTGYPNRLTADQIPIQSKMMTIADIYDALTAWDRPYKKAVPVDKALQILSWEVKDGRLDADLLDVFIQKEVYKMVGRPVEET